MDATGTPTWDEDAYILGTDSLELQRLLLQHRAWGAQAHALWERAGLEAGDTVLDLGCGPGYTSFDLARIVGPDGKVIAADRSAHFLAFLQAECERRELSHVQTRPGEVETLELPAGSLDAAYARWLFCWLPDPGTVLARVARALRPGGAIVLQDYLDWAAMSLLPRAPLFDRVVAACMASWHQGGGDIDVLRQVPVLAARCGLAVEWFAPVARLGAVGSLEWQWLTGFFASYLPRLVERGLLPSAEHEAFAELLAERERDGVTFIHTPTVADVILRKA